MTVLWLVTLIGLITTSRSTADEDPYIYTIPYENTFEDYPSIAYPKPGREIEQMDVSRVKKPNQIRLSLTGDVTEMAIMWTTNSLGVKECVRYGVSETDMKFSAVSTSHQYHWNYKKELGDFYYTSGFIHEALMINLQPGQRHYYQIESNGEKSDVLSFVAAPKPDSNIPISIMHLGDQGVFGTSVMVTKTMMDRADVKDFHAVVHCGDICYADKYLGSRPPPSGRSEQSVWDTWGQMMEPLASQVPYMVSPGNHEMVGYESGWENGTIYNKRFIMPENERYYSFGVGMVYMISVNTDDDIDEASTQGVWLEHTLRDIDREEFPWVVVFQHRPIYNSNTNHGNWTGKSTYVYDAHPEAHLPEFAGWEAHYEDLIVKYGVDFVLSGHVHHYERTWPVRRVLKDGKRVTEVSKSYDNVKYPVHITCGHAGIGLYTKTWSDYADEDGVRPPIYQDDWDFSAAKSHAKWGHCEMEFLDRVTAKHYMFPMGHSEPAEEVTITKDKGCEYVDEDGNIKVAMQGESYKDDCNTCVCGNNGVAGCTLMACFDFDSEVPPTEGCEYVDKDGNIKMAMQGESYEDDCNTCICGNNGVAGCTMMACFDFDSEVAPKEGCEYVDEEGNIKVAMQGESYKDDCNTCFCGDNGVAGCTLMACFDFDSEVPPNEGCEYVNEAGDTMLAIPGDSYSDGCNACVCQSDGVATCTERACLGMCSYLNKDMVPGWVGRQRILAWDSTENCLKRCKCRVKSRGRTKGQANLDCTSYPCEEQMATCYHNLMAFEVGGVIYEGCDKCTCMANGKMKCTNEACCLYIKDGQTARAYPGDTYSDGCNQCRCLSQGGACTRRGCPGKCSYKNWDLVMGYADLGQKMVHVFDEEEGTYGCPKTCDCEAGERGAIMNCAKGMRHCFQDG